jgi:hypothetical protein
MDFSKLHVKILVQHPHWQDYKSVTAASILLSLLSVFSFALLFFTM